MTTKTIKFNDDLLEQAEAEAKKQNRTFSGYVRNLVIESLQGREPTAEEQALLEDYDRRRQESGYRTISEAQMRQELESE